MQFSLLTLYISELEDSLHFYRDVMGMEVRRRMDIENGGTIVFLGDAGNVQLELIARPGEEAAGYAGFSIGFQVDSLAAATKRLEVEGVRRLRGPLPAGDAFMSFFRGPNGETVELIGP